MFSGLSPWLNDLTMISLTLTALSRGHEGDTELISYAN